MLKRALALCLALLAGLLVATSVVLALALQRERLIERTPEISIEQIARARQIVDRHAPGKVAFPFPFPNLRVLTVSQDDLDLLVNYGARQFFNGSTQVLLQPGIAIVRASVPVRAGPFSGGLGAFGGWLNVDATLRDTDGLPVFERLRVGRLTVPVVIANRLAGRLFDRLAAASEVQVAGDLIRNARFGSGEVRLVYDWRPDDARRVLHALMPPAGGGRMKAYSDRLVELAGAIAPGQPVSLAELLPPLFQLARDRSADGDGAEENRAAIIALAFYANRVGLAAIVPAAKDWPRPAPHTVRLSNREDSPLHFLVSAAIAAAAGSPLSDAIGVYKEVDDARHGSGFSFNDLAHDRAGTRFGELAIREPAKLQALIAGGVREADFMPDVADLPEDMTEPEFKARFGGVGAPAYQRLAAEIEARVASRPVFR